MALIQRRDILGSLLGDDDDKLTAPAATPTSKADDSDPLGLGGIASGINSVVSGVNGVITSVLSDVLPSHSASSSSALSSSKPSSASSSQSSHSSSQPSSSSSADISSSQPSSTSNTPSPVLTPAPSAVLSTSGGHVFTMTVIQTDAQSAVVSASPTATDTPKSFLQNKPLEITVFTFVGIIGLVLLISLSTAVLRRGRRRRMENDILSAEKENGFPHAGSDADLLSTHSDSQSGLSGVVGGDRLSSVRGGVPPRSATPDSYTVPPSAGYVQTAFNPSAYPAINHALPPQAFDGQSLGVGPSAGYGASGNYGYDMSQAYNHPASMMPQPPPSPVPRAPSPLAPLPAVVTRQEARRTSWDRASGNQSLMSPTSSLPPYSLTSSPAPQLPMPVATPAPVPTPDHASQTSSLPSSSPPIPQLPELTVTSDDDAYFDGIMDHYPSSSLKVVNE